MKSAGQLLLTFFDKPLTRIQKPNAGIVTEADVVSERYLIEQLSKLMPHAAFFAEESGEHGQGDYCWVIDPLDGTTNFARGIPYFCISVALTYKGEPIVSAIYQPILKELYSACKGKGAFLNGTKIAVSDVPYEKSALLIGLPYTKRAWYMAMIRDIAAVGPETFALRHMGAAALDLAYVAAGRLDGSFFAGLGWWDVAAGMLLVTEAGGMVSDFQGKRVDQNYSSCLAAGPEVYTRLLPLLKAP
ncbi:MAG TPA: inositol monophosphatase family protein [Candidatus Babeliales bacterium]|nr:inositol monophosphatase family protein [Candidatus Babeliales bacterium]